MTEFLCLLALVATLAAVWAAHFAQRAVQELRGLREDLRGRGRERRRPVVPRLEDE